MNFHLYPDPALRDAAVTCLSFIVVYSSWGSLLIFRMSPASVIPFMLLYATRNNMAAFKQ